MQRLNTLDSMLVYGEAGWPMHLASLQVYDAASAPGGLDVERVRDLYRQRLPQLPVFRQQLVRVPGDLDRPVWVEKPGVDVAARVHGVRVPAPGTDSQLAELAGQLYEPPTDLSGPLWETWVIEGLEGGRVAVLTRVHHAAVDGARGMEVQAATLDIDPAAPVARPSRVPGVGEDAPGTLQLLAGAAAWQAGLPLRLARTAGHLAQTTGRLADAARRGELAGLALPFTAPRTSLNGAVSTRRDYAFCSVSLAAAKQAARQEQVTVNDVVLALTGGALRRYLQDREELPARSLTTVVPLGLPADPSRPASGNRWAVMLASLATDVPDPVQRLHKIAVSARAAKAAQRAIGPDTWMDLTDLPPLMVAALARGYSGLRLANLHPAFSNVVVSNVRSAPFPLYLAGARMLASYPIAPIVDGGGLNVTVVSYLDSLDFGLLTCPDLVKDPWRLVDALRAEEAELAARYMKRPGRRRKPATTPVTPARARASSGKNLQKSLPRTDGGASPGHRSCPAPALGDP